MSRKANTLDIQTIIKDWLKDHGYDGLYNINGECGCGIDDLMPCMDYCGGCKPGYKIPDPSGEYNFLIVENKDR